MRGKRVFDEEATGVRAPAHAVPYAGSAVRRARVERIVERQKTKTRKGQITLIEKAFRNPLTKALQRELNLLRKSGVNGEV